MRHPARFAIALALPILAGGIGGFFTSDAVLQWYPTLIKPWFSPPNWIFGPVWTLLYILMGISCYRLWTSNHAHHKQALALYWAQLVVNAIWSPAFFGLQSTLLGMVIIWPLWLMIIVLIIKSYKIDRPAAWLLVPYLAWVSFASILATSLYVLN
ncbi:tryptophan-rich sensory protein [Candidatus Gracilibacteria bacterium]|nr:tryptophan-rich sensory protein [Candidatus Gracilibacteria bacterium]